MKIGRIWTLIKTELAHGPKDTVIVMAVVIPILLALFVNLAFGNIFSSKAKLGIYDEGNSQIVGMLQENNSLNIKLYGDEAGLKEAASGGGVDMGFVLPADFDALAENGTVRLKAYVWGESHADARTVIPIALADAAHKLAGAEVPVSIENISLGDENALSWSDRLLPLVVLMAVFFGGLMLPASSIINEKQHRTLEALNITPSTLGEFFSAKGTIGALLAFVMGVLTLAITGNLSASSLQLLLVLFMGAVMAAEIGLLAGAYINDMNTLYATWKFGGLLLMGPGIIFMFPGIPQWIGYIFPTFYVLKPVMDISLSGMNLGDELLYLLILAGILLLGGILVSRTVKRLSTQALRLNG
jgi:ABC-2 type transport system permease protein